ncbi:MAG: PASTA domain-containing protein [Acidobacteriia bacterium]|nr:PASTA domain-containing protein [Terriglobia bacterium]
MRQFFRMLLLALVLMTVALISALTAMQLAIHGREVTIPKLVGMSPAEAERAGAASGLQVVVERQFYSADIPEGKIMTQMPPPGAKVRRGWSVRVAQSLGPQRVAIPDVTGGSERVAELNIRRRGLTLGSLAHLNLPDAPLDQVISQSPPAKASGVSAPKISLLVSDGPAPPTYVMPNLTGQPLGSAMLALQDAGIKVGKVSVLPPPLQPGEPQTAPVPPPAVSEPSPASMIVTQTPAPGQKIVAGSAVNFEVR